MERNNFLFKIAVVVPAGCQKCNKSEINYCLGRDVIDDHCCCDRRYEGM